MALQNSINAPTPLSTAKGGTGNTAILGNGQLWIGNGTTTPAIGNITTSGTGLSVTNGPSSITITNTLPFSLAGILPDPTSSVTLISSGGTNSTRICRNTSVGITTFTLPTAATSGQFFQIIGYGTFGWRVIYGTNQSINVCGVVSTISTGSVNSTTPYDSIILYYMSLNNWLGIPLSGTLNVL